MKFDSYIVSETKTAFSVPLEKELLPKKDLKQKAFTLAETLITLSIIGVVAAITIPNLTHDSKNREHVARLKKAYTVISNAVQMIPVAAGCGDDYVCSGFVETRTAGNGQGQSYYFTKEAIDILAEQIKGKLHEDCSEILPRYSGKCISTEDGMVIYGMGGGNYHSIIAVDTNGNQGPNRVNRDIWKFGFKKVYVVEGGNLNNKIFENTSSVIIPGGLAYDLQYGLGYGCKNWSSYTSSTPWDAYCTNYVLKTGKMDYK